MPTGTAVSTPGTYFLLRSDLANCIDSTIITLLPAPLPDAGPDRQIDFCDGAAVLLDTLFTSASLSWSWDSSGLILPAGHLVQGTGVYSLVVTDSNACNDTALYSFTTVIPPYLGNDSLISGCIDSTLNLESLLPLISPGGTWIYNGTALPNATAVSQNGLYTYIDNFSNYCNDTLNIVLDVNQRPALGPDLTFSLCDYQALDFDTLFTLGGLSSQWTLGGVVLTNVDSIYQPGLYELVATNAAGCSDTVLVQIVVNVSPLLGPDLTIDTCSNNAIDLTAFVALAGLSSQWTSGGTPVAAPTAVSISGVYQLVAVNSSACNDTLLISLTRNPVPVLGADQTDSICDGETFDLNTAYTLGAASGQWWLNNAPVNNPAQANTAGNYMLIATTAQGCSDTALLQLTVNPIPLIGNDTTLTRCANTAADLSAVYSTAPHVAAWTFQGQSWSNPAQATIAGVYTLILSSASGCTDTAEVSLAHLPVPSPGPDTLLNACDGDTLDLHNYFSLQGLTPSWSAGGQALSNASAVTQSGNYMLTVIDANGCTDTAFASLTVHPLPITGSDTAVATCAGTPFNVSALFTTGAYQASWFFNQQGIAPPDSAYNAGLYSVLATNAAGCTTFTTATLSLNPKPELGSDHFDTLCSNQSRNLNDYFNLTGLNPSWTLNGSPLLNPNGINISGSYLLIGTDSLGCSDTASVSLDVKAAPDMGDDLDYDLCPWQRLNFNSLYATQAWPWKVLYNGMALTNVDSLREPGEYLVVGRNLEGCEDTARVELRSRFCLCEAEVEHDGACVQDPVTYRVLADSIILDVQWTLFRTGEPDPQGVETGIQYAHTGWQYVRAEARLACGVVQMSDSVLLSDCDSCQFYLPGAFSPNQDGLNDAFEVYSNCTPEKISLRIYNRFGELVYQTDRHDSRWDGNYGGSAVPAGAYAYRLRYQLPYRDEQVLSGVLMIHR